MATYQPRILVTNERERPLVGVDVHCIERGSDHILMRATTDNQGVATFSNIAEHVEVQFRAMNFRPSANNGNVRLKLLPRTSQDDSIAPTAVTTPEDVDDVIEPIRLVITTPPREIAADTPTATMTVQRRDRDDNPLIDGDLTVYLYSSSATGTFQISNTLVIPDGASTVSFTYTDSVPGTHVIKGSTEVLV